MNVNFQSFNFQSLIFNSIMTNLCNDPTGGDKTLHLVCGFIIAAMAGVPLSFMHFPSAWIPAATAFAVALVSGLVKEIIDSRRSGNHFCVWDLVYDTAGSLAGAAVTFVFATYNVWQEIIIPLGTV